VTLKIFNSLTKSKKEFKPVNPGKVGLYVCGMTVYDYNHIGHARSFIIFDMVVRYLRFRGFDVTYVRNITDIDDKIINRANELDVKYNELTERFITAMHEDDRSLNLVAPDHEPRATEFIPQIIELIQALIDKDFAYVADNGDVYFDVRKFKTYGKLAHRDIDELISGARVEISEAKRDPLDFILWKMAKPNEPKWDSPWGEGRPGWHIECSVMSSNLLGQPFDIHGGGLDLKFPHHDNEIAQSEAAKEAEFVKTWMHVGLLQINKEKMSKSLGNFFTIREVLAEHDPEVLRYFMFSGHYRSPVNYAEGTLNQVYGALDSLYTALRGLPEAAAAAPDHYLEKFCEVMDDDFNNAEALAVLFDMAHEINRLKEQNKIQEAAQLGAKLKELGNIFGLLQLEPQAFLQRATSENEMQKISELIAQRTTARQQKQWERADQIRDELLAMGIAIEDGAEGTIWRRE